MIPLRTMDVRHRQGALRSAADRSKDAAPSAACHVVLDEDGAADRNRRHVRFPEFGHVTVQVLFLLVGIAIVVLGMWLLVHALHSHSHMAHVANGHQAASLETIRVATADDLNELAGGSSALCRGDGTDQRRCRFSQLCFSPHVDEFVFFRGEQTLLEGVPANRYCTHTDGSAYI